MRQPRLLTVGAEHGSAPVESIFAIVMLLFLALGAMQVALTLYARNVVAAAAHEAARAVAERGRTTTDGAIAARTTVERGAGGLVQDAAVTVGTRRVGTLEHIVVRVAGRLDAPGPLSLPLPVDVRASATREVDVP